MTQDTRHGIYIVRTAGGRPLGHHEGSCSNEALAVVRAEQRNNRATEAPKFAWMFTAPATPEDEAQFEADLASATAEWVHPGPEADWLASLPE